jgi:hypothetical protein
VALRGLSRNLRAGSAVTALVVAGAVIAVGQGQASAGPAPVAQPMSNHSMAPGGYIDYQVNGKHHRHEISSFSIPSAYYKKTGNREEFGLKTGASNRMEHDTDHHYKSGRRQFQGELEVFSGISQQSVVQIFGGGSGGPILMIKCYGRNNGSLVVTRDTSRNLITNAFSAGKISVRLTHDVRAHRLAIYINGAQKWTGSDAGPSYPGGYNVKYGLYGTFKAATHTVWSDVTTSDY